ncbi:MAG: hydroxylamine reductase [Victivallaceae bacterium]|nr:hydroxylamine reductase [Victivallaceae bacterium]
MGEMFCFQCEQTACGTGCTAKGVCGKTADCANMQDLLLELLKEAAVKKADPAMLADGLFTTITNVNFDPEKVAAMVRRVAAAIHRQLPPDMAGLEKLAAEYAYPPRRDKLGVETASAQELLLYGLKGMAAYLHHARRLGRTDAGCDAFLARALAALHDPKTPMDQLIGLALECGTQNLRAMEILNEGHIARFGRPEPTAVRITPVAGKAILVSGHDLDDLEALLKQTEGTGINIYTHGEMLPAHGYPGLKKYKHLVGNYGGAWQDQVKEFDAFPGAILMTTNCIQKPRESYSGRIFTTGLVEFPGVVHVKNGDFGPVIAAAKHAPGFPLTAPEKTIMVGFGHDAVAAAAGAVVDAVKAGKIRHFFLIGGCDGAKSGRNYYTELAEKVPADCVILTLACGKFRFNKLEFGDIGGIPRLLDVGQCNDAYSAVRIAQLLAGAFHCGVNDLPLSIILSWYEQKAVAVLLTLLSLGIRNIKLGPSLPAFVSPGMLGLLVEKFNIAPISTPEEDLAAVLG